MLAKAGIFTYGDLVQQVLMNEFYQTNYIFFFTPILLKDLTVEQQKGALIVISIIRTCADGRKQRELFLKEEIAALIVHMDSFMIVICFKAK